MHNAAMTKSMQRIRILFIIPSFRTGGAEVQLLSLVRGLDKSRFDVTVAAFYKGGELDADFRNCPGVDIVFLQKRNGLDFGFLQRLLSIVRFKDIQIIQSYNVSARLFGVLTARLARKPIAIATERTARLLYSSKGSRAYLFLEKYALRSADRVIANSTAGQKFAESRGVAPTKSMVIYNGIDAQRIKINRSAKEVRQSLNIPASAFVVGMAARIEPLKDPKMLVEAARHVFQSADDIYFLLVGDGPMLSEIQDAIKSFELQARFIFAGHRTDSIDFLNAMDVVVLTSNKVEGCSNSLLESMWLSKAVVATKVGGNVELIEHEKSGLLISPKNPDELSAAILRLHDDAEFKDRLAQNGRLNVQQRFSQSKMADEHERLYEELLAAKERTGQKKGVQQNSFDFGRPFARSMILGCPVDQMTLDQCVGYFKDVIESERHCHIVVVNAAKVVKARRDPELREVIQNADLVGADGVPIVWASRLLNQPLPGRVNGTDLMHKLFDASAEFGWRLYLLGAKPDIIQKVVENLRHEQPTINIVGYRHGYFDSLEDEIAAVSEINAAQPDILMLGFGTPMKEKWVKRHKHRLKTPIIHGVGGSFDIVGGMTKRAPRWMQNSGLEWLYRLIQEPGRMWRRYLSTNTEFVWLVLRTWLTRLSHSPDSSSD
jgi:N-acetylglucosaminyldiphosphoundecaprenol N-acetyl-beta-D-mannosaminyltransferase